MNTSTIGSVSALDFNAPRERTVLGAIRTIVRRHGATVAFFSLVYGVAIVALIAAFTGYASGNSEIATL